MKFSKLFAILALTLISTSVFAQQKIGTVSSQIIMFSMPEIDTMQIKLKEVEAGLIADIEAIQKELVQKQQEYQRNKDTYSSTMKEQKEKDLQALLTRYEEFEQVAQLEMQEQQQIMLRPIQEKIMAAINKVSEKQEFAMIFEKQSAIFVSETLVTDITDMVIAELGITKREMPTQAQMQ